MRARRGASLIETLVVLAIIGTLLALLFPSLRAAHRRTLDAQCENNLRQVNLAIAGYFQAYKRLPGPGADDLIGGWTIDVLPFLDQKNLFDLVTPGDPIQTAPDFLLRQPSIFRCPVRANRGPTATTMESSSYLFLPHDERKTYDVADAPLDVNVPWARGLEYTPAMAGKKGPHDGGYFYSGGFKDGVFFLDKLP